MRRTVGIAFKSDGRHRDHRTRGELAFQIVVLRSPVASESRQRYLCITIATGSGLSNNVALRSNVASSKFQRCDVPDQSVEILPILVIAQLAAISRKVVLVPSLELGT